MEVCEYRTCLTLFLDLLEELGGTPYCFSLNPEDYGLEFTGTFGGGAVYLVDRDVTKEADVRYVNSNKYPASLDYHKVHKGESRYHRIYDALTAALDYYEEPEL